MRSSAAAGVGGESALVAAARLEGQQRHEGVQGQGVAGAAGAGAGGARQQPKEDVPASIKRRGKGSGHEDSCK